VTYDDLAAKLTDSIDALQKHVDERFESTDSKLQAFNHVISSLIRRMEEVESGAKERTTRIGAHDTMLAEHDYRLRAVEENAKVLAAIRTDMHDGFAMLARLMEAK
jgi:hypothetical protein